MSNNIKVDILQKEQATFVRITPPITETASHQDFVAVVDVSGSMGVEQSIVTAGGIRESHGYSTLDIVKHALKVKVNTLEPTDRFGLVAYHSTATIIFPLAYMDEVAKHNVLSAIENLIPLYSTNIYDGLEKAFQCFGDEPINPTRIRSVLLYTDGVNNQGPAEGPLEAFKSYIVRAGLPAQVSINGFGTETDPVLMRNLADAGRGLYFFTPDAGMIGTTSVNYMANLKTTVATQVVLKAGGNKSIPVGALLAGQSTYVKVDSPDINLNIPFTMGDGVWTPEEYSRESFRFDLIEAIQKVLTVSGYDLTSAREIFVSLARKWISYRQTDSHHIDLFTDLTGELLMALKDYTTYERWGKNYLLAMETAHANGKQTNFKDASLKGYTSTFREKIKTDCNTIFDTMSPPARSAVSARSQAAPTSMASYNNDDDPCMVGHAPVSTASGTIRVDQIRKGTVLANGAIVQCVVKTYTDGIADLVDVGGTGTPWITPYHPIRQNDKWCFPGDVAPSIYPVPCEALYSFVLDSSHVLTINGVECIGLGHGFKEPVAVHPYLGTDAILNDLKTLPGYNNGLVEFNSNGMRRGGEKNLIVGINIDRVRGRPE